ncbi:MAG: adenylate/guanylate cyclase domain-containing protein, partial [Anaerolineales bacterium]
MGIIDAYIPMDRRIALARGESLPDRTSGAVLFADISGFTRFNHAIYQELGSQLGAEELTQQVNRVYGELIGEVHRYGGSVISFGGDAITCWFNKDNGRRATACALDMQAVMKELGTVSTPTGKQFELGIKVSVTAGNARRFLVGQPNIQRIEVLAGEIL